MTTATWPVRSNKSFFMLRGIHHKDTKFAKTGLAYARQERGARI
jgi:hypothetical protein